MLHMLHVGADTFGVGTGGRLVRRTPFFYGWVILLAGSFGLIMSSPGQTYTTSIFIDHFIADLGVSRGMVSTLYMVGTLIASLGLPYVGRQIDVRGPRLMVGIIAVALGLACIFMGAIQAGWMLLLGFVFLRLLGQGSISLVSTYVINQWWVRRRGTIMGISGVFVAAFGLASFPNLVNWLIPQIGWRSAYAMLGLALIVFMAPIGVAFYRSRPETYGLKPDNKSTRLGSADGDADILEENWTLQEVRRTSTFWIISAGLASISMLGTGLTFHMVGIFSDNGLSSTVAAAVFVPIAFTSAAANLGSGVLVDRIPVRFLLATALLLQAAALWMAQALPSVAVAIGFGIVFGTLMGLMRTVSTVVWPTYFGRLHLGSIAGFASTISIAASALGPMPMGVARDVFGSYNLALMTLSILPLSLAVLSLFVRPPQRNATVSVPMESPGVEENG